MGIEDHLRKPLMRKVIHPILWLISKTCFNVHYSGEELLMRDDTFLIVANHMSIYEGFMIALKAPQVHFVLAKEECWLNPFYRNIIPNLGGIPTVRKWKLEKLREIYSPEVFSKYITKDGGFNYSTFFQERYQHEILKDIETVLDKDEFVREEATGLIHPCHLDPMILSKYLLKKNQSMLFLPQGTRVVNQGTENARYGLAKILYDLNQTYKIDIPIIACGVRFYPNPKLFSRVYLNFGPATGISSFIDRKQSAYEVRQEFTGNLMEEVRMLSQIT